MPARNAPDTDLLLAQAAQGNREATDRLLERHRPRLRQEAGQRPLILAGGMARWPRGPLS